MNEQLSRVRKVLRNTIYKINSAQIAKCPSQCLKNRQIVVNRKIPLLGRRKVDDWGTRDK